VTQKESSVMNQGMLEGLVFDDGSFRLNSGQGKLVVAYSGSVTGAFSKVLDRNLMGHIDFANNSISLDDIVTLATSSNCVKRCASDQRCSARTISRSAIVPRC
jgi:hypothetical protein